MKKILLFAILLLFFSCKKETATTSDNAYYKKARICRSSNNSDSAFYYYNLAKNEYLKIKDSLGVGNSLVNMAMIQTNKGDFYGGIESSFEANKFLRRENDSVFKNRLATNYNNIGLSYNSLREYKKAIFFYEKALKYIENKEGKYVCYNNIGDLLINEGNYKLAKEYLQKAILADSPTNYSRAINNLAKAKFHINKSYNPLPEFHKALAIRQKIKGEMALNSSFETLSTYYYDKDKKLSLEYAQKMLKEAIQNNSPDDQITALRKIITLQPEKYLSNFNKFDSINDNLQTTRNKHKSQFAMIRYDVAQKDAENQRLISQDLIKTAGISALILLLLGTTYWYIKRQKQLKQEKELEVKNTQLKMSKKVHDVVANGIYQVMTKIENQEHFDKDEALDELEFVYEKSRDISYEKADDKNEEREFSEKISELIGSFKSEKVNTYIAGNDREIWKDINNTAQEEVYQIIRELLVNMKKHSKASIVSFKFEKNNNVLKISYTDNGIGILGDVIYKNGLSSTVSRIETIGGEIIFDTKIEKGLKINISFPTH